MGGPKAHGNSLRSKVLCKILSSAAQGNRYEGIQGRSEGEDCEGEEAEGKKSPVAHG